MSEPNTESPTAKTSFFICWTTVPDQAEAERIARELVSEGIACCVQIDPPIQSFYRWKGVLSNSSEYRLWIKAIGSRLEDARKRLIELHSYDTPQWIEVEASKVDEKYLIWAEEASTLRGFQKPEPIQ